MAKRLLVTSAGTGPCNSLIRSLRAGHPSVVIIGGQGYSLMWPEGEEPKRYDWEVGTLIVPRFVLDDIEARYATPSLLAYKSLGKSNAVF